MKYLFIKKKKKENQGSSKYDLAKIVLTATVRSILENENRSTSSKDEFKEMIVACEVLIPCHP